MGRPLTLAELVLEHFDGVLATIERGHWGRWQLDQALARRGHLRLTHERSGYAVTIDPDTDWVALVAGEEWASAGDIGELIYAMRDLEYARWLGVLPDVTTTNGEYDGPTSCCATTPRSA